MPAAIKKFLDIQETIDCGFILKRGPNNLQITTQNTAQLFGKFDQIVQCSFTN